MQLDIEKFDAIIFDFGGIIINIDYQLTVGAFSKLGFNNFDSWYSQAKQHSLFDELEKGKISTQFFFDEIRKASQLNLEDSQIEQAWNELLLNLPISRIKKLISLKNRHKLFLLSNTNAIHTKAFSAQIEQIFGWQKFRNLFDGFYLSHEIGMRKPSAEIFEFVVNTNRLNKNSTLFIDDSYQHLVGAKSIGLQTFLAKQNIFFEADITV